MTTDVVAGLACFKTPGHASHHVSYLHEDGTLYAGDAAGVRVPPDPFVFAPSAPPEIDVPLWEASIDELERHDARRIALIHFGIFDDVGAHLVRLRETMVRWSNWVGDGVDQETFVARAEEDVRASGSSVERYHRAAMFGHSWAGLERYWRKRREAGARRMRTLERITDDAYASFYGDDIVEIAGARCLRALGAPDVPMLNRVVGLGVDRDVSDDELDAIERAMAGLSYYVAVSDAASPSLDGRLAERGFDEGWGWMTFERPAEPPAAFESALTVRQTTEADHDVWARIVGAAYGLRVELGSWIAATLARPNWTGSSPTTATRR